MHATLLPQIKSNDKFPFAHGVQPQIQVNIPSNRLECGHTFDDPTYLI